MVGQRVLAQDRSGPVERAAQQQAALRHQLLVLDRSNQHELAPEQAADDQRRDRRDDQGHQQGSPAVAGAAPSAAWTLRAGGEHRRDRAPSITEYVTSCTALAPLASGSENRSTCSAGAPSTICTLTGRADVDPSTGPAACARSRSI